jgi:pyruvate/2-oxoglutarate dehydrogenase complex dihydrolipoamide dehydrogenase (E3) component/uncharacterized membrane protein YdjX (TVP38/TMEM64 family)
MPETGLEAVTAPVESGRSRLSWVKIAVGAAALGGLLYLGRQAGGYVAEFAGWVDGLGALGPVAFIAGYAIAVVGFVPGSVLTLAAGAIFGVLEGTLYVFLAATLGSAGAFLVARYLARRAVERRLEGDPRFAAIDRAVGAEGRKIVFLLRLSPIFPFNLLNYAMGLTRVRLADYLIASLGMIPGTLLYVYSGKLAGDVAAVAGGTGVDRSTGYYAVLGLGFVATVVVTAVVTRIARRALDDATRQSAPAADGAVARGESRRPSGSVEVAPHDEHNARLVANVHPPDWVNPIPDGRYNLVVVGAGTAGLISALLASSLGAKVALIERHLMGGDCLNVGCVPSKALIRAGRWAHQARAARALGLRLPEGELPDFGAAMERLREIRARISREDSAARYTEEFGIDVYLGAARFTGRNAIDVDGTELRFRKAVIATGARPVAPPIPGLAETGYLDNETVFSLTERPARLAVIGAGPIGCEMAQTFQRLGSGVTVFEQARQLLGREDREAAEILENAFAREGIRVMLDCRIREVESKGEEKVVRVTGADGGEEEVVVDEILVGAGRAPNVRDLGLESAGVAYDERGGVVVDDHLRTTNRRIFSAGDVCMDWKFTHAADAAAKIVVQNALFLGRKRLSKLVMPWCTYTDPEVAHVGLRPQEAEKRGIETDTYRVPISKANRAVIDGEEEGFVKVHVRKGGDEIVGATIVASHAGEMISEITLAMVKRVGLGSFTEVIHPYPTQAEAIKAAAGLYARTRLTPFVKRLFDRWMAISR